MDIRSGAEYPASALSNFAAHPFTLDGVRCASMEGFLQSLKFDRAAAQARVCKLVGKAAAAQGKRRSREWQEAQTLWWRGRAMPRNGDAYQALLDRAYQALCDQSAAFREALLATGEEALTHSLGESDPAKTVLTEGELCSRLMDLRDRLRRAGGAESRGAGAVPGAQPGST